MPISIETLRVRLGLAIDDLSRDDEINIAAPTAMALMELYCDRKFVMMDRVEQFTHEVGNSIPLIAYPVNRIVYVERVNVDGTQGEPVTLKYHVDKNNGVMMFDAHFAFHKLEVAYNGGYDPDLFPVDLTLAFLQIFDIQISTGSGGVTLQAGAIESVTVQDVGTVRFSKGDASAPSSGGGLGGLIPFTASAILDLYKRYKC